MPANARLRSTARLMDFPMAGNGDSADSKHTSPSPFESDQTCLAWRNYGVASAC